MGPGREVSALHEEMGVGMIEAATVGSASENMLLRAEIGLLQEENAALKARLDKIEVWMKWADVNLGGLINAIGKTNERVSALEGDEITAPKKHIDVLVKWLEDRKENRKGMTYKEAAAQLDVDIDYISQLKDAINLDGRLVVEKKPTGNRRMQIRLA